MQEPTTDWGAIRSFRFSKELDEWITARAKTNLRSLNGEIAYILLQEKDREAQKAA